MEVRSGRPSSRCFRRGRGGAPGVLGGGGLCGAVGTNLRAEALVDVRGGVSLDSDRLREHCPLPPLMKRPGSKSEVTMIQVSVNKGKALTEGKRYFAKGELAMVGMPQASRGGF